MTLFLMHKSTCNASYSNMHIVRLILSVVIIRVQQTYHHINIHMSVSMFTHAATPEVKGIPRRKKTGQSRGLKLSF